jgi:serine/threonine-protein kinase
MLLSHAQKRPVPPSQISELPIPHALEAVIMQCLEKKPAERPESAADLEAELRAIRFDRPWTQARAREWWALHSPSRT